MTIELANAPNFRTLARLPTCDGRQLREGLLYRSGDLSSLSEGETKRLEAAGISLVIDLRSRYERERRPNRLPEDAAVQILNGDIRIDLRAANGSLADALRAEPNARGASRMMHATYQALPQALTPLLRTVVETMANTPGATLIQCTAGKDRTGCLVASVLQMLQVQDSAIVEDYLLTNACIDLDRMADTSAALLQELFGIALPRAALDVVNRVELDYLHCAQSAIHDHYGSNAQWWAAAGIEAGQLQALRQRFLT